MYKLNAGEVGNKNLTTEWDTRGDAIRGAWRLYGLAAHRWTSWGMDVNETTAEGITYKIIDPDGIYRRHPRVR